MPENWKAMENIKLFTKKIINLLLDKMFHDMHMNFSHVSLMWSDQGSMAYFKSVKMYIFHT